MDRHYSKSKVCLIQAEELRKRVDNAIKVLENQIKDNESKLMSKKQVL